MVDKITTEDIAISILIYENSVDVWEEDQRKKEDPNFHPTPAAVPKYHVKKGTRIVRFADGWTDEGRAYYKSVCAEIKRLKSIEFFWEGVKEHWKTYAKTHHRSYCKYLHCTLVHYVKNSVLGLESCVCESLILPTRAKRKG